MAIVNGTNYAKAIAGLPSDLLSLEVNRGQVRVIEDIYECDSAANSTTINVGRLFVGDRIVGGYILHDSLHATAGDIILGDDCSTADPNRYVVTATVVSTATRINVPNVGAIDTAHFTVDADCNLQILLTGAALTGTIRTKILVANAAER